MIYLLYGQDTYLRDEFFKKIKKEFGEIQNGINYIQINQDNISKLISNIEIPAFGYNKKMIVVKDSSLFKKKSNEVNSIKEYLEKNKLVDTELVFLENEAEKNDLYKLIEKIGKVHVFNEQKIFDLVQKVKSISNAYKVNIDNSTAQYFIECCGTNMNYIINEIRKLIEHAGENGTISKEDVDNLTIKNIESVIFELTDNLGKRDIKKAMNVLNNLIYTKEPVQKILIFLYSHIRKLYIVKLCNGEDLATNLKLKPNQAFLVNKYKAQAGYFKIEELENIMLELISLDENSKNGNIDLQVGLESILCRYV